MPITLKYGAPGAILQAGFAAGVGSRKQKEQKDLLDVWQQQTNQAFQGQQAELGRQQQLGLQQNAQEFQAVQQAGQNQFNRQFRIDQQKFNAEQDRLNRNAQAVDATAARFARAGENELDRDQQQRHYEALQDQMRMKGLASRELELPPAAQREMDKLEEGLIAAGKLEPAQQEEYRKKYEQRAKELRGFARPATKSPEEVQREHEQAKMQQQESVKQQAEQQKQQQQQTENFQKEQKDYSKLHQAEMQRLQSASEELDAEGKPTGKLKPLDSFSEEATKNLGLSKIFEPQQPAQQTQAATGDVQQFQGPNALPVERGQWNAPSQTTDMHQGKYTGRWDGGAPEYTPPTQQAPAAPEMTAQQQLESVKSQGYTEKQAIAYLDKIRGMNSAATQSGPAAPQPQQGQDQSQYTPEMRKSILEGSQLPKPQSKEEYDALPSGASYVYTDGTIRKKP